MSTERLDPPIEVTTHDDVRAIARRARDVLEQAAALVDLDPVEDGADADAVELQLDAAQDAVQSALAAQEQGRSAELGAALIELVDVRDELRHARLTRRLSALERVQRALSRLRGAPTPAAVIDRGLKELCAHCGFDRAVLFRVDGSEMVIDSVHFSGRPDWGEQFLKAAAAEPAQLTNALLETQVLRQRTPVLVTDAQNNQKTLKALVRVSKTTSYVAAPIMPEGNVIGLLHADCYFEGRDVDTVDRDILWAFAEGFGFAVERALLLQRLHRQRAEFKHLVAKTEATIDEFCDAEVALLRSDAEAASAARSATSLFLASEQRGDGRLTPRELEVLTLMADGATNAGIASQLMIGESTVKTHVKHVLRKLGAGNRAEAVSRFHCGLNPRAAGSPVGTPSA